MDEVGSVVDKSTNSNVTFSAVEFSTSYTSNVVNGVLDDASVVISSLVVLSAIRNSKLFIDPIGMCVYNT